MLQLCCFLTSCLPTIFQMRVTNFQLLVCKLLATHGLTSYFENEPKVYFLCQSRNCLVEWKNISTRSLLKLASVVTVAGVEACCWCPGSGTATSHTRAVSLAFPDSISFAGCDLATAGTRHRYLIRVWPHSLFSERANFHLRSVSQYTQGIFLSWFSFLGYVSRGRLSYPDSAPVWPCWSDGTPRPSAAFWVGRSFSW